MARISYKDLLTEVIALRERCARLEAQVPAPRTFRSFSDRAKAYCAEHRVKSVPHTVVAQWRAEH